MTAINHKGDYKVRRAADYPNTGEQLDALWKELGKQSNTLHPDTKAMLVRVNDVKARYPKPIK